MAALSAGQSLAGPDTVITVRTKGDQLTRAVKETLRKPEKQTTRYTLPDDPAKAWTEVEKVHPALQPPADWRTHEPKPEAVTEFQKQVGEAAVSFADKAREFIERFPTNENIGDARITVVYALTHAVAAGRADAETRITAFVSAVLADQSIPEDDRAGVLLYAGNAAFMKKVGMRLFTEGLSKLQEEFETAGIESMRSALKQFPANSLIYTMLVAVALDDKEAALRRFLKEKELPWPQHFEGKGWENQLAVRYGIFSIPTMWLVDKRGNLRDTDARFDLERRISSLLDEPALSSPK